MLLQIVTNVIDLNERTVDEATDDREGVSGSRNGPEHDGRAGMYVIPMITTERKREDKLVHDDDTRRLLLTDA